MDKPSILKEIDVLIDEGNGILKTKWYDHESCWVENDWQVDDSSFKPWIIGVIDFIGNILPEDSTYRTEIKSCRLNSFKHCETAVSLLGRIRTGIENERIKIKADNKNENKNYEDNLKILFDRFHRVARQLKHRHDSRPTFDMDDEYDVQDLFHGLLYIYFDDVRSEESNPSFAGANSRGDFLLADERIIVEIKKPRKKMTDAKLGEEIIIDAARYKTHPSCDKLICFVYDPEEILRNPQGLMNDLNKQDPDFLHVIIRSR